MSLNGGYYVLAEIIPNGILEIFHIYIERTS